MLRFPLRVDIFFEILSEKHAASDFDPDAVLVLHCKTERHKLGHTDGVTTNALFTIEDDHFVPSEFTRGPWRADAQHGGPPSALLGSVTDPLVDANEVLAHIEVELVAPVPLTPLYVTAERVQVSGRVHRVHALMYAGGSDQALVARSNALVLRASDIADPEWAPATTLAVDPPSEDHLVESPRWANGDVTTYHRNAVEHRFTGGDFRIPGPAVDWQRLRGPVIEGQEPSPLERVLAAADFGSGISAVYGATSGFGLINANLCVSLVRPLEGEWVSLDAVTHVGPASGLGITTLGDTRGQIGIATQSLLGYRMH